MPPGTSPGQILGRLPRRVGYDGRVPVAWAAGDRRSGMDFCGPKRSPWSPIPPGALSGAATIGPSAARRALCSATAASMKARAPARSATISTPSSPPAKKPTPADLLAIQLDDRALFLARWQQFLLEILTADAVADHPARADLRAAVQTWNGRASADSVAYRVVPQNCRRAERALAPFIALAQAEYAAFNWRSLPYEDALWQLVHEQPERLLNPAHATWPALLLAAADDVTADVAASGGSLADFTWGARNTLRQAHPFSRFLPKPLARLLDMQADPLPGDGDMPRVQGPRFGQSERLVATPAIEDEAIFQMPGGQSGHPLSPSTAPATPPG